MGILLIAISVVLIGVLKPASKSSAITNPIPFWIPILMGVITPFVFTIMMGFAKHVTLKRNVNVQNLSFNSELFLNSIVLIMGIIRWSTVEFRPSLIIFGIFSGIFEPLGKAFSITATSYGLAGPASAIMALSPPLLVVVESIEKQTMLSTVEMLSLALSIIGILVLVAP